ncbi:hypothetical protein BBD40_25770 [Paenibacillus ihbetae]|uniref:Pyrrolo-quinoline quinone repeat domain-containing protein n=2 Tax=Paenibacillus ihbetae TaxID=1870820 RepID=A0ABX3JUV0_9BACL|nr:hypothetical protein BBD40_25770 [Paenibacillus ihbetae]
MQPTGHNWNRNSRFAGVNSAIHIKWTYKMPSGGNASIVIGDDGTVFTKSYDLGGKPKYKIHAINPDGTLKWEYATAEELTHGTPVITKDKILMIPVGQKILNINTADGIATETILDNIYPNEPVLDSDGSYYLSGPAGRLAAYNSDGTQKWKSTFAIGSSPGYLSLSDTGSLIFKASGNLYSYDTKSGTKLWEFTGINSDYNKSSPALSKDGTIYVTGAEGFVYAINPNGTLKWKFAVDSTSSYKNVIDPIVGSDGTVYAVNGTKNLYAINPDGTLKWKFDTNSARVSPILDSNGIIYIGAGTNLIAVNAEGLQQWSIQLDSIPTSAPAIAEDGTIYIATNNGTVYAIGGEVIGMEPTEPPVDPEPPVEPVGERAIFVITLNNGTEKEYDLSMQEVQEFISWYEGRAAGSGPVTFAINKHNNNKGPFKQRQDYIVFDKIITFEVNEY